MNQKRVKILSYKKHEIAKLFGISRKKLMTVWINNSLKIFERLRKTGYIDTQQYFTLKQTEIIFETFGHPEAIEGFKLQKSNERVPVRPYSKSKLAELYNINIRSLRYQIDNIPNEDIIEQLFDKDTDPKVYFYSNCKKMYSANQVTIIFEWLGHPYKD